MTVDRRPEEGLSDAVTVVSRRQAQLAVSVRHRRELTVLDLTVGSGLTLADRGEHDPKDVPSRWRLYALVR